jgi:hypothetical protein
MASITMTFIFWALTALIAGFGAYFGAYLKKKGQRLATHEDMDKIVEEVRAVTKATKEIEAKIQGDIWDEQRRWELKRDTLISVAKAFAKSVDKLGQLSASFTTGKDKIKAGEDYQHAAAQFDEAMIVADLICSAPLADELLSMSTLMRRVATDIMNGKTHDFSTEMKEVFSHRFRGWDLIRDEIQLKKKT